MKLQLAMASFASGGAASGGAGGPRPLAHFCHGLESGPGGFKARKLAESFRVAAPDMHMSLWNPFKANSFARNMIFALRRPSPSLALCDSFQQCLEIQRQALEAAPPDVLVGSSWGGGVAAALLAEGRFHGPFVLLCPALRVRERRAGIDATRPELSVATIEAGLAALPDEIKARGLLVHGTGDTTVPIDDSRALSELSGIALLEVAGGSHGLGKWTASGGLEDAVNRVLGVLPGGEQKT